MGEALSRASRSIRAKPPQSSVWQSSAAPCRRLSTSTSPVEHTEIMAQTGKNQRVRPMAAPPSTSRQVSTTAQAAP